MKHMILLTMVLVLILGGTARGDRRVRLVADSATANSSLKLYEKDGANVYGAEFRYLAGEDRLDLLSSGTIGSDINRMSFLENGDIGIGTADPDAKLEINADSGVADPHLLLYETDEDGSAKLFFKNNATSSAFMIEGSLDDTHDSSKLYFNYSAVYNRMSISGDGGVGIGTENPRNYKLRVYDTKTTGNGIVRFENQNSGADADVLELKVGNDEPGLFNQFLGFKRGPKLVGNINYPAGEIVGNSSIGGVSYTTTSSDFAEWLPKLRPEEIFEPGDIVGIEAGKITRNTHAADYVQVITTAPGWVGNWPGKTREPLYEMVAFLGQVPVKVRGEVHAGDYIVASGLNDGCGVAVAPEALNPDHYGRIVGRAWDASGIEKPKMIRTAVSLHAFPSEVNREKDRQIEELEDRVEALERMLREMTSTEEGYG